MKLMPSIDIDFDGFTATKDTFKSLAGELLVLSNKSVLEHINRMKGCWSETTANEFLTKETLINEEIMHQTENIIKLIEDIEREAVCIFDAEMFGRGLALCRSY